MPDSLATLDESKLQALHTIRAPNPFLGLKQCPSARDTHALKACVNLYAANYCLVCKPVSENFICMHNLSVSSLKLLFWLLNWQVHARVRSLLENSCHAVISTFDLREFRAVKYMCTSRNVELNILPA